MAKKVKEIVEVEGITPEVVAPETVVVETVEAEVVIPQEGHHSRDFSA